jgi:hypothetical protein
MVMYVPVPNSLGLMVDDDVAIDLSDQGLTNFRHEIVQEVSRRANFGKTLCTNHLSFLPWRTHKQDNNLIGYYSGRDFDD